MEIAKPKAARTKRMESFFMISRFMCELKFSVAKVIVILKT
jgi:hypothetical protein